GRQYVEGQLDLFGAAFEFAANGCERIREETVDLGGDFLTVLLREIKAGAWKRIGIGTATDGCEHNRAGMIALQKFLRVASPVAAYLVELAGDGRAVTGVVRNDGAQFAFGIGK